MIKGYLTIKDVIYASRVIKETDIYVAITKFSIIIFKINIVILKTELNEMYQVTNLFLLKYKNTVYDKRPGRGPEQISLAYKNITEKYTWLRLFYIIFEHKDITVI